ncbi:hypothetical protein [Natronoarchaeum rubrum]|uniref:hypothetical protein n=1 Tax=Natronoarchaeum rubrum TaxID=755311 RepID=UPI00211133E6|nr:hypothetical protein [Natronoarchaeum rubrum]
MPDKRLHHVRIGADSQRPGESSSTTNLAALGILSGGSSVESLSLDPGQRRLEATVKGTYAEMVASEIEELFAAPQFGPVVYCTPNAEAPEDGYYVLEDGTFARANTRSEEVQQVGGTIREAGTKGDDWRALRASESQVEHDEQWGNSTAAVVSLPAVATKVQWLNEETRDRAPASAVAARTAQFGEVDDYNLADGEAAVGASNPTLIYDLDYADEVSVGQRVYDTRGFASKYDTNGERRWMVVTRPQHDFDDAIVLDSGALRLKLDEVGQTIAAEEWDAGSSSWTSVSLTNDSAWSLFDVDVVEIGMVRAEAQLTFSAGSDLFALDAIVTRGADAVLFDNPQIDEDGNGPATPSGIVDWLDPIAASTLVATGETKGLVSRDDVRR